MLKLFWTEEICAIKNMPLALSSRACSSLGFSPGLDFLIYFEFKEEKMELEGDNGLKGWGDSWSS